MFHLRAFKKLLGKTTSEYGLAYKLNEMHLNVSGQERQSEACSSIAVQLLSRSYANALKYLGEKVLLEVNNWRETWNFINLIDRWFDVINSNHMYSDKSSRYAFGINTDMQMEVLDRVTSLMSRMKVKSPKTRYLYKFQKGVRLSCQSLIGLFDMLKSSYNIEYLLTQRLNPDYLDNFFGWIRQISGPHHHPNAVNLKFRLRTLILGRKIIVSSGRPNTKTEAHNISDTSECDKTKDGLERELALEMRLTTLMFKDMDFNIEEDNDYRDVINDMTHDSPEEVIKDEALRYIGGYIVRKFSIKYPDLGCTILGRKHEKNSWIECIAIRKLYAPSKD